MDLGWICHVGAGAGVLVAPDRVVTAGHVIDQLGPGNTARCEVFLPGAGVSVTGCSERAVGSDLAIIRLDRPLAVAPAPVRPSGFVQGHRVLVPGNLTDTDRIHRVARAQIVTVGGDDSQFDVIPGDGYAIVGGHSGGPVIDEELGAVIGICRAKEQSNLVRAGWWVPVERIGVAFPELSPWLGWRLSEERPSTAGQDRFWAVQARLDEARIGHWYPRATGARGTDSGSHGVGDPVRDLFSGRVAALDAVRSWTSNGQSGVLFVTGRPGAGKSAVVARVVVDADPVVGSGTGRPFRCAFHAKDRSALDLVRALSDALGGRPGAEPEEVINLVRRHRPLVAIDGLDEATGTQATDIVDVARRLGDAGGHVLVGARRSVIPKRIAPEPLDLDEDRWFSHEDLVDYCLAVLRRLDRPGRTNQWRNHPAAPEVAAGIADRAGRNFLVGALLALARADDDPDSPGADAGLDGSSTGPTAAFDGLLDALDRQLGWRPR